MLKLLQFASSFTVQRKGTRIVAIFENCKAEGSLSSCPWPGETLCFSFCFVIFFFLIFHAAHDNFNKGSWQKKKSLAVLLEILRVQASFIREEKPISSFLTIQSSALVINYWERMSSSSCLQNHELTFPSSKKTGWEVLSPWTPMDLQYFPAMALPRLSSHELSYINAEVWRF